MQDLKRMEVSTHGLEQNTEVSHLENYRGREKDREIPIINVNRQENYMERERLGGCVESTRKDNYGERNGDGDLLDIDLQDKDDHQKTESCSRFSGLLQRTNGNISRPSSYISKRSINCSTERLSEPHDSLSENTNEGIVCKSMYSLGLLSLSSLAMCIIAVQLLFSVSNIGNNFTTSSESLLNSSEAYGDIVDVAVAMSTFVIVLDISCVLVSSMQCIFMLQILQLTDGEDRAMKYLKECSSSRYIVVFGFFLSLPTLLVALILFMVIRFRSTTAIIATVILSVGILFSALSIIQNACQWQIEKSRENAGLPVYDAPQIKPFEPEIPRNELSTLV